MKNVPMDFNREFINKVDGFVKMDFIAIIKKKKLDSLIGVNNDLLLEILKDNLIENTIVRIDFSHKINVCSIYNLDKNIEINSTIQPLTELAMGNTLWLVCYKFKDKYILKSIVNEEFDINLPKKFKYYKDRFNLKINNLNLLNVINKFELEKNIR